jgi:hypothetical protein
VQGCRRCSPAAVHGRCLGRRSLQSSSKLLGPTSKCGDALRRCTEGQHGRSNAGGDEIPESGLTCGDGSEINSGACGAGVGEGGLGEVPGAQAKLLRRFGLAMVRWSGKSMAEQSALHAEQGKAGGARVCGSCGGDVRAQRGAGRQLKEAAGILGMRATDGKVGEDCGRDGCNAEEADREQRLGVIRLRW